MSSGFSFWKKEVNKHVPIYRVTVSDDVEDGQVMVKFVVLYQGINEWTVEFSVLAEWSEHGKLLIHATEQTIEDQDVIQNTGAVVVRLVSGGTQRETPLYAPFVNMGRLIFAGLKRVYEVK
ncbi:hypothetical protein QFC21_003496 [Naganishia friedmannii]|uniref:Uncharacterized protein n=1 Tax=Naganishia friedmannii TaxID=89922 RepID=A0ACC2VMZ9_9TREE|nr:hypothetical protein QFC21_003496 [Naganishia friedmannii]